MCFQIVSSFCETIAVLATGAVVVAKIAWNIADKKPKGYGFPSIVPGQSEWDAENQGSIRRIDSEVRLARQREDRLFQYGTIAFIGQTFSLILRWLGH